MVLQELNRVGVHSKVLSPAFRAGAPVVSMAPSPGGYVSAYRPYSSVSTVSPSLVSPYGAHTPGVVSHYGAHTPGVVSPYGAHTPEVVRESIAGSTLQLSIAGKTTEQLWNDSVRLRVLGDS